MAPNEKWLFPDPPDVAVFTTKSILEDDEWIGYVSHDEDEGAWQFHTAEGPSDDLEEARVVLLKEILAIDSSLRELADLPLGWCAWRESPQDAWERGER